MSDDIRAVWHVTVGMTIGNVLPDYSRSFKFTDDDAESPASAALFAAHARAALEYAFGLYDPNGLGWVRVDFVSGLAAPTREVALGNDSTSLSGTQDSRITVP